MGRNRIGIKHGLPSDTEHQSQVYARAWGFYMTSEECINGANSHTWKMVNVKEALCAAWIITSQAANLKSFILLCASTRQNSLLWRNSMNNGPFGGKREMSGVGETPEWRGVERVLSSTVWNRESSVAAVRTAHKAHCVLLCVDYYDNLLGMWLV